MLKLNADYYADKYQKLQEKAGTQQASKRSPEITRDHPRSPEPRPSSREKDAPRLSSPLVHLGYTWANLGYTSAAPRLYPANLG